MLLVYCGALWCCWVLLVVSCVLFEVRCVLVVAGLFAAYVEVMLDDCMLCGACCLQLSVAP